MSGPKADDKEKEPVCKEIPCVQVTIRLDKAVYHPEDEIHVQGTLTNIAKKELIVNTRCSFPADIFLTIKTENDTILKWLPPAPPRPLTKDDFRLIKPGEEINFRLSFYSSFLYDKLEDGKYTIQARYTNSIPSEYAELYQETYKSQYCEDPVYSNIAFFEINGS